MDEFLKVVYDAHISNASIGDKCFDVHFKPFLDRLREMVSDKVYNELDELFTGCVIDNVQYYGVEGMKIAIEIMNHTYKPTF